MKTPAGLHAIRFRNGPTSESYSGPRRRHTDSPGYVPERSAPKAVIRLGPVEDAQMRVAGEIMDFLRDGGALVSAFHFERPTNTGEGVDDIDFCRQVVGGAMADVKNRLHEAIAGLERRADKTYNQ